MAYTKEETNDLRGILLLMFLTLPVIATTNIDCKGRPFHCVNSTHFMICVDIGNGLSSTIDNYVIPCPPTTVCQENNRFECEFPPATTAPLLQHTEAVKQTGASETHLTKYNDITTVTPPKATSGGFLKGNFNTVSVTTLSEDRVIGFTTQMPTTVLKSKNRLLGNVKNEQVANYTDKGLETTTSISNITISVVAANTVSQVNSIKDLESQVNSIKEKINKLTTSDAVSSATEQITSVNLQNKEISSKKMYNNTTNNKLVSYETTTETINTKNENLITNNLQPTLSSVSSTRGFEIVTKISDMNITKDLVNAYEVANFDHTLKKPVDGQPIYNEKVIFSDLNTTSSRIHDNTTEKLTKINSNNFTSEKNIASYRGTTVVDPIIITNESLISKQEPEILKQETKIKSSTDTPSLNPLNASFPIEKTTFSQFPNYSAPLPLTVITTEGTNILLSDNTSTIKKQNTDEIKRFQNDSNIVSKDKQIEITTFSVVTTENILSTDSVAVTEQNMIHQNNTNISHQNYSLNANKNVIEFSTLSASTFATTKTSIILPRDTFISANTGKMANMIANSAKEINITDRNNLSSSTIIPAPMITAETVNTLSLNTSIFNNQNTEQLINRFKNGSDVVNKDFSKPTELPKISPTSPLSVVTTENILSTDSMANTNQNIIQPNNTNIDVMTTPLQNDSTNATKNVTISNISSTFSPIFVTKKTLDSQSKAISTPSPLSGVTTQNVDGANKNITAHEISSLSHLTFAITKSPNILPRDTFISTKTDQMANENNVRELNITERNNFSSSTIIPAPMITAETVNTLSLNTSTFINQNTEQSINRFKNGSDVVNKDFSKPTELPKNSPTSPLSVVTTENILSIDSMANINQDIIQLNNINIGKITIPLQNDSTNTTNNVTMPNISTTIPPIFVTTKTLNSQSETTSTSLPLSGETVQNVTLTDGILTTNPNTNSADNNITAHEISSLSHLTFATTKSANILPTNTLTSANTDQMANNIREINITDRNNLSSSAIIPAPMFTTETVNRLSLNTSTIIHQNTVGSINRLKNGSDVVNKDFSKPTELPKISPTSPLSAVTIENILSTDSMANTNQNIIQLNNSNIGITTTPLQNDSTNATKNITISNLSSTLIHIYATTKTLNSQSEAISSSSPLSAVTTQNIMFTDDMLTTNQNMITSIPITASLTTTEVTSKLSSNTEKSTIRNQNSSYKVNKDLTNQTVLPSSTATPLAVVTIENSLSTDNTAPINRNKIQPNSTNFNTMTLENDPANTNRTFTVPETVSALPALSSETTNKFNSRSEAISTPSTVSVVTTSNVFFTNGIPTATQNVVETDNISPTTTTTILQNSSNVVNTNTILPITSVYPTFSPSSFATTETSNSQGEQISTSSPISVVTTNQNTKQANILNSTIKTFQYDYATANNSVNLTKSSSFPKVSSLILDKTNTSNILPNDTSTSVNQYTDKVIKIIANISSNASKQNIMESNLTFSKFLPVSFGTTETPDVVSTNVSTTKKNMNTLTTHQNVTTTAATNENINLTITSFLSTTQKFPFITRESPLPINTKDVISTRTAQSDVTTINLRDYYTTSTYKYDNTMASNASKIQLPIDINISSVKDDKGSYVAHAYGKNITTGPEVKAVPTPYVEVTTTIGKIGIVTKDTTQQEFNATTDLSNQWENTAKTLSTLTNVQNSIIILSDNVYKSTNIVENFNVTSIPYSEFTIDPLKNLPLPYLTSQPDNTITPSPHSYKDTLSLHTKENTVQNVTKLFNNHELANITSQTLTISTEPYTSISFSETPNDKLMNTSSVLKAFVTPDKVIAEKSSFYLSYGNLTSKATLPIYNYLVSTTTALDLNTPVTHTTAATDTTKQESLMTNVTTLNDFPKYKLVTSHDLHKISNTLGVENITMATLSILYTNESISDQTSSIGNNTHENILNNVYETSPLPTNPIYTTQITSISEKSINNTTPALQYNNQNYITVEENISLPVEHTTTTFMKQSTVSTTVPSLLNLNVANQRPYENSTPLYSTKSRVTSTFPFTTNKFATAKDKTFTTVYNIDGDNYLPMAQINGTLIENTQVNNITMDVQTNTNLNRTVGKRNNSFNTETVTKQSTVYIKLESGKLNNTNGRPYHGITPKVNTDNISNDKTNSVKSHFVCPSSSHARYADNDNCRKFYICIGKNIPIIGRCPVDTVFSEIRKQCTKNVSHCIRNNQFHCSTEGRFSDFLSDNMYYICVKTTLDTFVRFKLKCLNGYHLNKTAVRCVPNKDISDSSNSDSKSNSDQSSAMVKHGDRDAIKSDFECVKEGKFVDLNDRRKYYICSINNKLVYRRKIKKCDSGEIFHDDKKKCVDADSFERK